MNFALFRLIALLALTPAIALAQPIMTVVPGANTITPGNPISYTVTLANPANQTFPTLAISSVFPTNATPDQVPAGATVRAGFISIPLSSVSSRTTNTFTLSVRPASAGLFTNTFTLHTDVPTATNIVTTVITGTADLEVTASGLVASALTNDVISVTLRVRNAGPNAAPNVVVTNSLPTNSVLRSLTFSNDTSVTSITSNHFNWNVGALGVGITKQLTAVLSLPTAGGGAFSASVTSAGNSDPTAGNNTVSTNISVEPHITNTFRIEAGPQVFNRQNALFEQIVTITNIGAGTSPGARLIISGMRPEDRLYRIAGTNSNEPFVLSSASLAPNTGTILTNYFFFKSGRSNPGLAIRAMEVPGSSNRFVDLNTTNTSTNATFVAGDISISSNIFSFTVGTTPGRNYQIAVSDQVTFPSNTFLFTQPMTANSTSLVITNALGFTNNRFFRALEMPTR